MTAREIDYAVVGQFIGGQWITVAPDTFDVVDPTTGQILGKAPQASKENARAAIAAARQAFDTWSQTDPWERAEILRKISGALLADKDKIARTITLETGKPIAQARGEVVSSAAQFDWCADEARRIVGEILPSRRSDVRLTVRPEPVGVVLALTSWNFPVNLPARKLSAALAAGCTVILRPSEEAPASAALLMKAMQAAGLPPGVANLLIGRHESIMPTLLQSPSVRALSFTVSVEVGKTLAAEAAGTLKKVMMELGGHAPALVCPAKWTKLGSPLG